MIKVRKKSGVVFLDIDGVILPHGALKEHEVLPVLKNPYPYLGLLISGHSKEAVIVLTDWLNNNGGKCVLISTWRRHFPHDFIIDFLRGIGLYPRYFHKDWVANFRFSSHKINDIATWLDDHKTVKKYVTIDDEDLWSFGWKRSCPHVRPNPRIGLVAADFVDVFFKHVIRY